MAPHLFLVAWLAGTGLSQAVAPAALEVRLDGPAGRFIRPDGGLRLLLSRARRPDDGTLAVVIANADWTSLFTEDGGTLTYRGGLAHFPQGDSRVVVYLVTQPNAWCQIASLTLHVTTPAGFERAKVTPTTDIGAQGQAFEQHAPASNAPARSTFQDLTGHLGFNTDHRRDGVGVTTQTNLIAVSTEAQALRFGQLGARASKVDLSDYAWAEEQPHLRLTLGNVTFKLERHLAARFATRGIGLTAKYAPVDITLAEVNGQSIVGFDNFLGVSAKDNQIALGLVGAEIVRNRPGAARVELSFVDGARQAQAGFTQGQVDDVLRSHGEGIRFLGSDHGGRLHLDTGVARNWSTNPNDPLLAQGLSLVSVQARTSDADYLDASYDVLHGAKISAHAPTTVSASYKLERVDPFFTSVAMPQNARSDVFQQTVGLTAAVGPVNGEVSRAWSYDNLGHVASIVRTDTGLTNATITVPTGSFGQSTRAHVWWPVVAYALNRSSQVGEGLPPNGGSVSALQVPDQVNVVHNVNAAWTFAHWHTSYTLNRSFQDNRQPGRETADFGNLSHQVAVGLSPTTSLDIAATFNREVATNVEIHAVSRTTRLGATVTWRIDAHSKIDAIANRTAIRDATAGPNDVLDANLQYSYALALRPGDATRPRLEAFGRWTWQSSDALDAILHTVNDRRNWTLSTGVTLTVF